jgi:hypothetical protein
MSAQGSIIIYLAGPIDDVTDRGEVWREEAASLVGTGVLLFSPAHAYLNAHLVNAQSLDWMNKHVIRNSAGLLANLGGPGRGLGTIREIEFARLFDKPVAVVGDFSQHLSAWDLIFRSELEDALDDLIKAIGAAREQRQHPLAFFLQSPPQMGEDEA